MFSNIGSGEILIVAIVLLFLFGGKKLPELAKGLGESGKELKKAKKEIDNALSDLIDDTESEKKPKNRTSTSESKEGGAKK